MNNKKGRQNFKEKIDILRKKSPTKLSFGERMLLLRLDRGYTNQEDFAKTINLSKSAINKYENNIGAPDYHTLKLISEKHNASYDYLFGYTESMGRTNKNLKEITGFSDEFIENFMYWVGLEWRLFSTVMTGIFREKELLDKLVTEISAYVVSCKHYKRDLDSWDYQRKNNDIVKTMVEQHGAEMPESIHFTESKIRKFWVIDCFTKIIEKIAESDGDSYE
jgi:transcriptional regulator with XRE-family HTH domain